VPGSLGRSFLQSFYEVKLPGAETFGNFGSAFILVVCDQLSFFSNLFQIAYVMVYFVHIHIAVLHIVAEFTQIVENITHQS
jgi:hypothetical protein